MSEYFYIFTNACFIFLGVSNIIQAFWCRSLSNRIHRLELHMIENTIEAMEKNIKAGEKVIVFPNKEV